MAGSRPALGRVLRIALAVIVLGAVTFALVANWDSVVADLRRVSPGTLALSFLVALLPPVLTMFGWRLLLAELGSRVPVPAAAGIFFVGQLGKFVPGSVWSVLAQAEMGARLRVPRQRTAVVGLIGIGMAAITGLITGLPALPYLLQREGGPAVALSAALMVPLVVILLSPALLNRVIAIGLRVLRRPPLEHSLSARAVYGTAGLFVLAWLCSGLHLWILARSIAGGTAEPGRLAFVAILGFILASSIGMFSVVLPAGVGVREGLLALVLASTLPLSATAALVVLSRFLMTVADVLVAAVGWAWARSHHLVSSRRTLEEHAAELGADSVPEEVLKELTADEVAYHRDHHYYEHHQHHGVTTQQTSQQGTHTQEGDR